jgi:glycyl-tRNA synthetase
MVEQRRDLEEKIGVVDETPIQIDASTILSMAKRRGLLWPAFEIYGGLAGFYDYGPIGSILRENIINLWRKYFVFGERCAEIVTPDITPEEVFKASGHVGEFTDFMVQCQNCQGVFRADHLLEHLELNADDLTQKELEQALIDNNIKCTDCKGDLSSPEPVNLMFETKIGLGNPRHGYLRPETAQGMFINFQMIYRYFRDKLPFGAAQIGKGYRNEISPRQGIIRLREMTMAELEYFFNPNETKFEKFGQISNEEVSLVPEPGKELSITLAQAVDQEVINSEIMAYFIGLTKKFLCEVGIHDTKLRFRKHQPTEMAHYASECWDAEAFTSFGWLEIIGIANRSAFDLNAHINATGQELTAYIPYDQPVERDVERMDVDMKALGPLFKGAAGKIKNALEKLPIDQVKDTNSIKINVEGTDYDIPNSCYKIEIKHEKLSGERIIPNVLEPSFGIDRIFYSLLEHSFQEREVPSELAIEDVDEKDEDVKDNTAKTYRVLTFLPWIAPIKVGVFPLMPKDGLEEITKQINETLRQENIQTYHDESGSIGRRYARMDEIGTPFCVTVDYDTKEDNAVTIRDRDSHGQARVPIDELSNILQDLIVGKSQFSDLLKQ